MEFTREEKILILEQSVKPKLKWIDVDKLELDEYQRETDLAHVRKLESTEPSWLLFGITTVVKYPGSSIYYVVDGGHRKILAKMLGQKKLPCAVYDGVSFEEAAAAFPRKNSGKRVSSVDKWRALRCAKDPGTLETDAVLSEHCWGIRGLDDAPSLTSSPTCVTKLNSHGLLGPTLTLINEAWPDADAKLVGTRTILGGCAYFLRAWMAIPDAEREDWDKMVEKLAKFSLESIDSSASAMCRHLDNKAAMSRAICLADIYNTRKHKGLISIDRLKEMSRQHGILR